MLVYIYICIEGSQISLAITIIQMLAHSVLYITYIIYNICIILYTYVCIYICMYVCESVAAYGRRLKWLRTITAAAHTPNSYELHTHTHNIVSCWLHKYMHTHTYTYERKLTAGLLFDFCVRSLSLSPHPTPRSYYNYDFLFHFYPLCVPL